MPPLATSKSPFLAVTAEVNAPLTWPKRVDSSSSEGTAPVLTGNERAVAARGVGVDGLGDQLLAGAAFALDQHGGAAGGDLGDEVEEAQHRLALPNDVFKVVALLEGALELHDLFFGAAARDRGADVGEQLLVVPGLLDEVLRACPDRVHNIAYRPEGGDHDDRQIGLQLDDAGQQLDAALSRQSQVEQQKIVLVAREQLHAGGAVHGG